MTSSFLQSKYFKASLAGLALALAFFGMTVFAAWAPSDAGPVNEPSGATPQEQYYPPAVTLPAGPQQKVGRLGVGAVPPAGFDFNTEGNASFIGGIWASAGVFFNNVCIGTPSTATAFCPGGNNSSTLNIFGRFESQGPAANIQNDQLQHTTTLANGTAGLERVCSTGSGDLRLCIDTGLVQIDPSIGEASTGGTSVIPTGEFPILDTGANTGGSTGANTGAATTSGNTSTDSRSDGINPVIINASPSAGQPGGGT